jgi:hypothetical protein
MSDPKDQDETNGFVCESVDSVEIETKPQEVDKKEEPASSESANTEALDTNETKDPDLSGKDTAAEQPAKKQRSAQKRIDQAVRQREDVKRENETLKREIEGLKGKSKKEETSNKEPVESDFETYDKYLDALDVFDKESDKKPEVANSDDKDKGDKSKVKEPELTDSQKSALAVTQELVESADKPEDFDEVALNPELSITGEMLEALSECDDPAKVMYHLGQNKDLATEIANKTPAQQMREIARLDFNVISKPKKPTQTTEAPAAINPVNGSDSQQKSDSEMTFKEFEEADRKRAKAQKSTW